MFINIQKVQPLNNIKAHYNFEICIANTRYNLLQESDTKYDF